MQIRTDAKKSSKHFQYKTKNIKCNSQLSLHYSKMLWFPIILLLLADQQQQHTTLAAPPSQNFAQSYNYFDSKCTDEETGRELYVGESFNRPGRCIKVQCLGTLQIWEDKCGQPKLNGNCTVLPPANEFLQYPKCCPLFQCKKYHRNEYGIAIETSTYDHFGVVRTSKIDQEFTITDIPRYRINSTKPHVIF